ncbi:MAG: transglycosylase SLT domain-containing protein [Candidatus Cloacimonetes bacterium]|nr:transglycosylase SLT domain-containing protein [Candidatus Cloacimonadota bacterium]
MARKARKKRNILRLIALCLVLLVVLTYNPISVRLFTLGVAVYYDLDPGIFYRLVRAESAFRSFAVSSKQAIGLGQIQEETARYIHASHKKGMLYLPLYNLQLSARYLHYLHDKYSGNWSLVLAAYNWGETNVSKRISDRQIEPEKDYRELFKDIPETYKYIGKILPARKKA